MQPDWRKEPGFTLIEMLVVIAIIGILAALLIPVVSMAKTYAKSAPCKNHLRQMGVALQMYVHDDQDQYPRYLGPGGDSYGDATESGGRGVRLDYWSSKLFPYYPLNWMNISLHCPGYNGKISGPYDKGAIDRLGSYAYNGAGVGLEVFSASPSNPVHEFFGLGPVSFWKDAQKRIVPPVSQTKISVPSDMLAICDSLMKNGIAGGDDVGMCSHIFGGDLVSAPYILGHGNNYNALFCDGHVGAMSPETLFNPTNSAMIWNIDHQPHSELWW